MSHSTDKLALLTNAIASIPDSVKHRVKTLKLTWRVRYVDDNEGIVCPEVEIELYPPTAPDPVAR